MQQINSVVNQLITAAQIIGAGAIVLCIITLGYQVWWGGKNGMEVAKKLVVPLIIGGVLVFGAQSLGSWLQSIVS